jgi:hypothetical protein
MAAKHVGAIESRVLKSSAEQPLPASDTGKHEHGYPVYLIAKSKAWEADMERNQEVWLEKVSSNRGHRVGYCCSGAWYLGVVSAGGNTNLGWSVVQEALNPRRVEERAFCGAGLPPSVTFYRDHGSKPVPFIADMTFNHLASSLFGQARSRESALGIGITKDLPPGALRACREMPEILHCLVLNVLGDPQSNALRQGDPALTLVDAETFIRTEIGAVFKHLSELIGTKPENEARATIASPPPAASPENEERGQKLFPSTEEKSGTDPNGIKIRRAP